MRDGIDCIIKYTEYLRQTGLSVSVHFSDEIVNTLPKNFFDSFRECNVHTNPYCTYIKKCDNHRCIRSQQSMIKGCQNGVRVCHAGVKEYVTTFFKNGVAAGIVSVSGYRDKEFSAPDPQLWRESLSDSPLPMEDIETLIPPLAVMLESFLEKGIEEENSEYNRILQYLSEYYITASLEGICTHFHRSRSHVSHLFKKSSGMTLRAYCNKLKLEAAERLIRTTDVSVTRIALDQGFSDVSHFINLFRKKYGVSPLVYRKRLTNKNP